MSRDLAGYTRADLLVITSSQTCATQLLRRSQTRAKRAVHEMMYAERRTDCEAARLRCEAECQAKCPKAVESLSSS